MLHRFSFVALITLLIVAGCPSTGDDPARKEIRPPKAPPKPAPVVNEPINEGLRERARAQIDAAFQSSDAVLRANAIEALQDSVGAEGRAQIIKGLADPQWVVRFASAMAAGTLRLSEAHATLLDLAGESDRNVQVAARYALHRLGDTKLSHDLEKMSQDPDRAVRANVAMVLGRLGEKSGLLILRTMTHDNAPLVRLQVSEAMWRLGDREGLEALVALSISQAPDDRIVSTLALAGPKDQRVAGHVYANLVSDYPEVSLAAARGMGMLGSDAGYTIAQAGTSNPDPRQKVLAALALGAIGRSDAQPSLARLLNDGNANVRLAAATGILQLKPPRA